MSWETLLLHASQPFVEFLQVRQKPHLGATVGFVHKIFERAALSHVSRDVAQDHEAPSVRHEFLNDVTRKTCLESEKIVFQPLHWTKDQLVAENRELRQQLAELRAGRGIFVDIAGSRFALRDSPSPRDHLARTR